MTVSRKIATKRISLLMEDFAFDTCLGHKQVTVPLRRRLKACFIVIRFRGFYHPICTDRILHWSDSAEQKFFLIIVAVKLTRTVSKLFISIKLLVYVFAKLTAPHGSLIWLRGRIKLCLSDSGLVLANSMWRHKAEISKFQCRNFSLKIDKCLIYGKPHTADVK